jgi:hypothetical protein
MAATPPMTAAMPNSRADQSDQSSGPRAGARALPASALGSGWHNVALRERRSCGRRASTGDQPANLRIGGIVESAVWTHG